MLAWTLRLLRNLLKIICKSGLHSLIKRIERKKEPPVNQNKNTRSVKIVTPYMFSHTEKFFNTKKGWGNLELTTEKYADYYIIVNTIVWEKKILYYNPKRTLLYYMEPSVFIKQIHLWDNSYEKRFFHVHKASSAKTLPIIWLLSQSYCWLKNNPIPKTKIFSTVQSDKNEYPLHEKRLQFLKILDQQTSIDIYGRINKSLFYKLLYRSMSPLEILSQYLGELPVNHKDEGLLPYKYHFASENHVEDNYVTEKLTDAILAECLCFYHGTQTAKNWIDSRAFIQVDITKPAEAINTIKQAIENNEWENRIEIIRKEKQKILDTHIFTDVERVISQKEKIFKIGDAKCDD